MINIYNTQTGEYKFDLHDISIITPITLIQTGVFLFSECFYYMIFFKDGKKEYVYSDEWRISLFKKGITPARGYIQQKFYDEYNKLVTDWKLIQ